MTVPSWLGRSRNGHSRIILSWIVLAGLYLACVGSLSTHEAVAAVLCGGLGALWTRLLLRRGEAALSVRGPALRPLAGALARLPLRTGRVGPRLVRAALRGGVSGESRPARGGEAPGCPFGDGPEASGARAISVLATSLAPDAYVLRLEPGRARVLIHAILPDPAQGVR